jgi:hypothetical protein
MLQSFMITAGPTSSSPLHPLHSVECHSACTVYPEPRREPSRSERSEGFAFDFSPVCVSANVDALDAASSLSPLPATLTKNTRGWVSVPIVNPIFRSSDRPISNSHRIKFFAHPHPLTPIESYSCKNRGEGVPFTPTQGRGASCLCATRRNPRNPNLFMGLLHNSRTPRGVGPYRQEEEFQFTRDLHGTRVTEHGPLLRAFYPQLTTRYPLLTLRFLKPPLQMAHPYLCTCKKGPAARETRYPPCAVS